MGHPSRLAVSEGLASSAPVEVEMNKVANIDALIASIYNINKVMGIEIFDALADFERIEDLAEMPWSNDEAFSIKAGLQDMQLDGYDIPGSLVERFDIAIV